jgi:GNAT superfamily N-acetyltransferase
VYQTATTILFSTTISKTQQTSNCDLSFFRMASLNLQFRTATPEDANQIQELVQAAFRTEDSRSDWTGNAELASSFRIDVEEVASKIANPENTILMALDNDNSLVASIEVAKREGSCGRLSMIAVSDRYQRSGVGRLVLAYAEAYCRRVWGAEKFSLNALSIRKSLIEWYMRQGYQKTGETSPFPRERFINMTLPKDMCFIEMEKAFTGTLETAQQA